MFKKNKKKLAYWIFKKLTGSHYRQYKFPIIEKKDYSIIHAHRTTIILNFRSESRYMNKDQSSRYRESIVKNLKNEFAREMVEKIKLVSFKYNTDESCEIILRLKVTIDK